MPHPLHGRVENWRYLNKLTISTAEKWVEKPPRPCEISFWDLLQPLHVFADTDEEMGPILS